jgi:mannobiose 2-epimerase
MQPGNNIEQRLQQLKQEMRAELEDIIFWWWENMPPPTGIVLTSRVLWTFSVAGRFAKNELCRKMADKAFHDILHIFFDKVFGGVFWAVDEEGNAPDRKKQLYGQAFAIYGLSEYYRVSGKQNVLNLATHLFNRIEQYCYDETNGGYCEALTWNWQPLEDMRLSGKDENASKTMNTHLHLLEAYACLYTVWKDDKLREKVIHLLELFDTHFIDKEAYHLRLFFDNEWNSMSTLRSYGHDIEASWLLQQCAEMIDHDAYAQHFRELAVKITNAATEGLDTDGGLWYEADPAKPLFIKEKHWWCQAEAVVGFINACQLTLEEHYLDKAFATWEFIKKYIKDYAEGEWFWGVNEDYSVIPKEKAGFWKCPYHNARACMEVMSRLKTQNA